MLESIKMKMRQYAVAMILGTLSIAPLSADEINVPDDFPTIQAAIDAAANGDEIIVQPAVYTESIDTLGKAITVRSIDPSDPDIVAQTVLDADGTGVVVQIVRGERRTTAINGFTIRGGSSDLGGGMVIAVSDPIIRNCVIEENTADRGGGAYLYVTSALFEGCTFQNNAAVRGGGIWAYATSLPRFHDCVIINNTATLKGGGVGSQFASIRLKGCLVANNVSDVAGGGYSGNDSQLYLLNSVVRDNVADRGGAFDADDTSPRILNSTVVQNTATEEGGAIYGIFSQPLIRNSIVRDNGPDPFAGFGGTPAVEFSNTEPLFDGPGNIDLDPLFADPGNDDFRLVDGSPSINAGRNGWVPSYSFDDLDGRQRIIDGTVDMGAFESGDDEPPAPRPVGGLVAAITETYNLAYGFALPLMLYDDATNTWSELVPNLPASAIVADDARDCFWLQNGETGFLACVPYDTLRQEEIAPIRTAQGDGVSISGLAVRDGVLYATASAIHEPEALYTIDVNTGVLTELTIFPDEYEVWDLHYDEPSDRLLIASSSEEIPPGPLGLFEIDLDTFELTEVQSWVNPEPFREVAGVRGGAAGSDRYFLFRTLYNNILVFDQATGEQQEDLALPNTIVTNGRGWVFGGLSWTEDFGGGGPRNLEVNIGEIVSGGMDELTASDDRHLITRSGFGTTLLDLHTMEMTLTAQTTVSNPDTLEITIESHLDEPSGIAEVYLFNHASETFDLIEQYALSDQDSRTTLPNIDAAEYVNADGEIALRLKHNVFAPFLAFSFQSFVDQVEIRIGE